MDDTLLRALILAQLSAALYLVGVTWFVQIAYLPTLAGVVDSESLANPQRQMRRMTWVVAPPMAIEGITAVLLLWYHPAGMTSWLNATGVILLAVIWLSTALIQADFRKIRSRDFDTKSNRRLVSTNWIRTCCWTMRGAIVIGLAWTPLVLGEGNENMAKLKVGDAAPEFSAITSEGQRVSLSDYRGQRGLVLFFYPKDGTSVCTKEACAFRDSYVKFSDAGVEVIGISSDSDDSHRTFATQNKLSFPLISDADGSLQKAFGVKKTLGLVPGRVTFVIDKQGTIRHIYSALLASDEHVRQALSAIDQEAQK